MKSRLSVSPPLELDRNTNSTTRPAFSLVKEGVLVSSCLLAVGSNQVEASGCSGVWLRKPDNRASDSADSPQSVICTSPWLDCPALRFPYKVTAVLTNVFTTADVSSMDNF